VLNPEYESRRGAPRAIARIRGAAREIVSGIGNRLRLSALPREDYRSHFQQSPRAFINPRVSLISLRASRRCRIASLAATDIFTRLMHPLRCTEILRKCRQFVN